MTESIPLLEKAKVALQGINQKELVELKALNNPPKPVAAVGDMLLLFRPNGIDEGIGWNAARTLMGNPIKMLSLL